MSNRFTGALFALGAVLIWGLTFVPSKVALAEMGPFTLAVLRFSLALIVILGVALKGHPHPSRWRKLSFGTLALLGFTSVTLYFGLQNLGLARTSASEAGLVSGSVPAITALLSALTLRERISSLRWLGIVLSITGVAAVVLAGQSSGSRGAHWRVTFSS
ncbi:MAG: DMT family transporter [Chloroflexi bacterium]|nr:DMT family transporter [Chloroflexota bacterium]